MMMMMMINASSAGCLLCLVGHVIYTLENCLPRIILYGEIGSAAVQENTSITI